jgi:hypothetical protein
MAVTILALLFLVLLLIVAFAGFRILERGGKPAAGIPLQKCSLCLRPFEKNMLIERQVGDYRLLHFCGDCIDSLHADYQSSFSKRI